MSEVRSWRAALETTIGEYITGEIIITYVEFEENMDQHQKGNLSHRKGGMSEEHEHESRINANLAPDAINTYKSKSTVASVALGPSIVLNASRLPKTMNTRGYGNVEAALDQWDSMQRSHPKWGESMIDSGLDLSWGNCKRGNGGGEEIKRIKCRKFFHYNRWSLFYKKDFISW